MYHSIFIGVFILSILSVESRSERGGDIESIRAKRSTWGYGGHRPSHGNRHQSSCDADTQIAMAEVKSEIQDLQQLLIGLRQKLDPDFKLPPSPASKCPPGFEYAKLARSCYKVIYEGLDWTAADQRCHDLHPKAHLVAITTRKEDTALQTYLTGELAKNAHIDVCKMRSWGDPNKMLWTSLQRQNETSCDTPFVWKISNGTHLPLSSYTHWSDDEPNCGGDREFCVHIRPSNTFEWNDLPCDDRYKLCPLCEVDPL